MYVATVFFYKDVMVLNFVEFIMVEFINIVELGGKKEVIMVTGSNPQVVVQKSF